MITVIKLIACLTLIPLNVIGGLQFKNESCFVLADYPTSLIRIKDLATGQIIGLDAVKMPIAMVEKDNFLYILGYQSFTVAVIDLTVYKVVRIFCTDKTPLELTHSETHILVDQKELCPLFPIYQQFSLMQNRQLLPAYFKEHAFLFNEQPFNKSVLISGEFKDFIDSLKTVALLSKELIFDFLSSEEAMMTIILLSDDFYVASGEWKLRRKGILNRLCIRVMLQDRMRAQHLIKLLMTVGDPLTEFESLRVRQPLVQLSGQQNDDDDGDQPNG